VTNVALFKKVTASVKPFSDSVSIVTDRLSLVTDGDKEANDRCIAELRIGVQWVQVDLGADCVVCWLDHRPVEKICRGVIVAVADDDSLANHVRVLFNNDKEILAGLGIGKDKQYFETRSGKHRSCKSGKGALRALIQQRIKLVGDQLFY